MSDSTMRGMRLGAVSFENERNVKLEARLEHEYRCPAGHVSLLKFAADAEVPPTWECKHCSKEAALCIDGEVSEAAFANEKTPRSHWEMLLERRTREELQELLDEQLENLRVRRAAATERMQAHELNRAS
jgi:ribosomal protein L37AE/L43A